MNKIYQIHEIYEDCNGRVLHNISYVVGDNKQECVANEYDEVYSLEVSEQTILDEINHCNYLIDYWTKKPNYPKVYIIIKRQENLINYYNKMLKELRSK